MILFKFREKYFAPGELPDYCCFMAERWVFEVDKYGKTLGIGFSRQIKPKDGGDWYRCGTPYYELMIDWDWRVGRIHAYYDGPHDQFSLGFLHLCWSGEWCDKCANGE